MQKKCIKTIGSKLEPTVNEKMKLRGNEEERGGTHISTPKLQNCEILATGWTFALKF